MDNFNYILGVLSSRTPVRSGDMLRSIYTHDHGSYKSIYIPIHYTPYTNEPWISPKWKGRENKNLYWIEEAVEYALKYIGIKEGGDVRVIK